MCSSICWGSGSARKKSSSATSRGRLTNSWRKTINGSDDRYGLQLSPFFSLVHHNFSPPMIHFFLFHIFPSSSECTTAREPRLFIVYNFLILSTLCRMFGHSLGEITFAGRWRIGEKHFSEANADHSQHKFRAGADARVPSCYLSEYCQR